MSAREKRRAKRLYSLRSITWKPLVALLLFLIVLAFFLCEKIDDTFSLGLIGIIASLFFGLLRHRMESGRVFKELFESFNSKYDHRFNDLI